MAIQKKLAEIKALYSERDRMIGQLERALAIHEVWPEAFDNGKAVGYIAGSPSKGFKYYIRSSDHELRSFEFSEVPECLTRSFLKMRKQGRRRA
jgi:hypothetical protein